MADDIKIGGIKKVTTGGDSKEFAVPSVDDQIKLDRYRNRGKRTARCIRLVMERRV